MSKQKKEEERRILAELDEAVAKEREENPSAQKAEPKEGQMHCRRCRSVMENGVCPTCGYKVYVGMSEEKMKKIRTALTVVGLGIFVVLFVLLGRK